MYLSIIFAILTICCVFAMLEEYTKKLNQWLYWIVCICLICIAACRPIGMDNDSNNYTEYFNYAYIPKLDYIVEWSFLFIARKLGDMGFEVRSIFWIYATIGISVKFFALKRLSMMYFIPIAIYIGNYYILHDFTQIRGGVASAFFLLGLYPLYNGQKWKAALCFLIATFFHYSSIIIFIMFLVKNEEMKTQERWLWAGIVPLGYLLYLVNIDITSVPIPYIGDKIEAYKTIQSTTDAVTVNVLNTWIIAKIAVYYYILYYYNSAKKCSKYFHALFKMFGLSIFLFVTLTSIPVLSFRISELFGISEIILLSCFVFTIRPKMVGSVFSLFLSFALLLNNIILNLILKVM